MRSILLLTLVIGLYSSSAIADITKGACIPPYVQRDFPAGTTTIYSSTTTTTALYRVCSFSVAIQLVATPNSGTPTTFDLAATTCLDVSVVELGVKTTKVTTGDSVIYCKIG